MTRAALSTTSAAILVIAFAACAHGTPAASVPPPPDLGQEGVPFEQSAVHPGQRVRRALVLAGVDQVEVRGGAIEGAKVVSVPGITTVRISGIPVGGAEGYHPADPGWRETPPEEWPFDFRARRYGRKLVISTSNEMSYIHHQYVLTDLVVEVPPGIEVSMVERELSGDGAPSLAKDYAPSSEEDADGCNVTAPGAARGNGLLVLLATFALATALHRRTRARSTGWSSTRSKVIEDRAVPGHFWAWSGSRAARASDNIAA